MWKTPVRDEVIRKVKICERKMLRYLNKLIMRKAKYARYLSPVVYLQPVNIPLSFFLNINLPQVLVPAGHLSYHLLATDFRLQIYCLCFDKYHRLWVYLVVFLHELYNSAARLLSSTTIQGNHFSFYISGSFDFRLLSPSSPTTFDGAFRGQAA